MKVNRRKTLEQLENEYWGKPDYDSHLVITCHALRRKPLQDFDIEDLRVMIGQNISLDYLVPLAIEKLSENILAEGDFYEGVLLKNVLHSDKDYWIINQENWRAVCNLFKKNKKKLEQFDTTDEIRSEWFKLFEKFEKLNQIHNKS